MLGRSAQYFLSQTISLENTMIHEPLSLNGEPPVMETLMDNRIGLRLCDQSGRQFYINDQQMKLGIVLLFNTNNWNIRTLIKEYEIKKRVVDVKDDNYQFRHKATDLNSIPHLFQTAKLNPGDNSLLEMNIAPDKDGIMWLHAFLVAGDQYVECRNSPI